MSLRYCIYGLIIIALFSEINGRSRQFRCDNGKFINNEYFCDGDNDCRDNSDESYGCSGKVECRRGKFTCENQLQCVNITARCNTQLDCLDGSDERNCSHELSINNCTIEENKFLCNDKLRCLHLNETCDGYENCFDNSDEDDHCFEYDFDVCSQCGHSCLRTPLGPQCFYNRQNGTFNALYGVIKDCNTYENNCDQKCVKFHGGVQCSCGEHYENVKGVPSRCESVAPYGQIVIYSTRRDVKVLNTTSGKVTSLNVFPYRFRPNAFALTGAHNYAYCIAGNKFVKRSINSKNTSKTIQSIPEEDEEIIIPFDNYSVYSIAIDWITGNIYFNSRELLSVCDNSGRLFANLIRVTSFSIECVALAPKHGLMFWITNSKNKFYYFSYVHQSAMDGSKEDSIVWETSTIYKSLVVDENSEKLYWLNTLQARIESTSFYDYQFKYHERKIEKFDARNFFSFGVFENVFYWTLDFNNIIHSDSNSDIFHKRILPVENSAVEYLYVYNPFLQQTKIPNPCSSNPCKGLCVTRTSLSKIIDYTCICEDVRFIKNSSNGGGQWCNNFRNWYNDTVINDDPTEMFSNSTTSPNRSSTTKNQYLINPRSENAAGGGMKTFFVIIIIALLSAGSYFLVKKWKENGNRGGIATTFFRNRDGMRMRFFGKNDNADDL